mgnify:CR=1 FL=1
MPERELEIDIIINIGIIIKLQLLIIILLILYINNNLTVDFRSILRSMHIDFAKWVYTVDPLLTLWLHG